MALAQTDIPLDQLKTYSPDLVVPDDLDEFWRETLAESRSTDARPQLTAVAGPITEVIVEDLVFPGFAGDPVRGWVIRPKREGRLPAVIEYIGYGGGRGLPSERLGWATAGFVHVIMDTRGQGSGWGTGGDTPDPHGTGASTPGFMTRGIDRPEDYYYRRVFTDGVRLVDAVLGFDFVDPDRIAVTGGSQGGGISIAVAALSDSVSAVMPDVPFLCDFPRAIERSGTAPFSEITKYLSVHRDNAEAVLRTLSYFDGAVLARRISAPALFSVALMDEVVLPSTVYAAFNSLGSEDRAIEIYPYNGHEGGLGRQWLRQVDWLRARV